MTVREQRVQLALAVMRFHGDTASARHVVSLVTIEPLDESEWAEASARFVDGTDGPSPMRFPQWISTVLKDIVERSGWLSIPSDAPGARSDAQLVRLLEDLQARVSTLHAYISSWLQELQKK